MTTLTYRQARLIVLGFGTALLIAVAAAAYFRGADLVEVGAMALFLPILYGLAFFYVNGGVAAAVAVSIVYVTVRFATIGDLAGSEFIAAAIVRVLLYLGLGVFGGAANRMLSYALQKLELYDEIDDLTGVGNARSLLDIADREVARATRYQSIFSLAVLKLDRSLFDAVKESAAGRTLRRVAQTIDSSVRTTDAVARVPLASREDLVVVLPQTGREGAEIFLGRLVEGTRQLLVDQGLPAQNGLVTGSVITFPGDDDELRDYRDQVAASVAAEWVDVREAQG